jgi:hypothetical protein
MPGGGPVIRPNDTVGTLWFGLMFEPAYGGLFVAVTFAGRSDGPAWWDWAVRAFIALFFCSFGSVTAAMCFRELQRRGAWLPPGVARHPWLAPAGYVVLLLVVSTAVIVGFVACVELCGRWLGGS